MIIIIIPIIIKYYYCYSIIISCRIIFKLIYKKHYPFSANILLIKFLYIKLKLLMCFYKSGSIYCMCLEKVYAVLYMLGVNSSV